MPVLAPEGTAARKRPSVVVMSHSTVGLPRESKICSEPARAHSVSHTRVAGRRPGARLHLASMDGGDLGHGCVGSESERDQGCKMQSLAEIAQTPRDCRVGGVALLGRWRRAKPPQQAGKPDKGAARTSRQRRPRLGSTGEMCVCEGEGEESGWTVPVGPFLLIIRRRRSIK